MFDRYRIVLAFLIFICLSGGIYLVILSAIKAGASNQQEVEDLCKELNAEFVQKPEWLCIKDGEIVYGESK